jgi:ADP-ribosylglycohydrolase
VIRKYFSTMADESKIFLGLLNGITKHDYYEEDEMDDAFLKQELYPEMSWDDFQKLTTRSRGLVKV